MDLYQMVLNIIPGNIISPFQTGNALQIIFLACICGAGTLVLGDSVSEMAKIVSPDQYFDPAAYDLYQQAYPAVCIYLHDESVFIR